MQEAVRVDLSNALNKAAKEHGVSVNAVADSYGKTQRYIEKL